MNQLRSNIAIHLKFFRRNRLLLAIGIVFLLVASLYTALSVLFESAAGRFELIRAVFMQLSWYSLIFTAALGLVLMSTHLRGKSVKLVFSKPCSVETWVGSGFLAAILVSSLLYATIWLVSVGLSLVWGIPVQGGFGFIALEMWARAIIAMAMLTFLATVFHPIVAILLMLFFNEGTFYGLRTGLIAAFEATGGNPLLPVLEQVMFAIYMMLPMQDPLGELTGEVYGSLRAMNEQWGYLAMLLSYTTAVTAIFYFLSVRAVYRRNLM